MVLKLLQMTYPITANFENIYLTINNLYSFQLEIINY